MNSKQQKASEDVRKKIIYVDDVSYALITVQDRLKKHYKVYPAQTSEQLFEILDSVIPDLLILDVNMPVVNGFEIIKRVKDVPLYANIPVVFLTGNKDRESVVKCMELGAVDVLFKPITDSVLIEAIEYQFNPEKQKENKPIILAVDDNPSILRSVNQALKDNYTVLTLSNPELLSEVLKKVTPDLFILDCNMPKVSGFELIPRIRKTVGHEETPVVFLTSEVSNDTVFAALGLGAGDYIVKPVEDDVLREKVAVHLKNFIGLRRIRSI